MSRPTPEFASPPKRRRTAGLIMTLLVVSGAIAMILAGDTAGAQDLNAAGAVDPATATATRASAAANEAMSINPASVLEGAAEAIPGFEGGLSGAMNILILLTVLTLAPAILIMCTCFTRMIIVLGLVRQAMGTQSLPPSQTVTGLALFLTFMIMAPTAQRIYHEAIVPYQQGDPAMKSQLDVWSRARIPIRDFMFAQIEATDAWDSVYMILEYRGVDISNPAELTYDDVDLVTLIPAFILSELKVAFLIGFRMYLPFLIIDMVIASLLISMGMLMLPPVLISLPFKILLFVLVDGWNLIVGNLMTSFVQPEYTASAGGSLPGLMRALACA